MFITPIYQRSAPRVVLRPSSLPVSAALRRLPQTTAKGSLVVLVDHFDTGVRVPGNFTVHVLTNRRGDLAGSLEGPFSGAYSGTVFLSFLKPRGCAFRLVPVPSGHEELRLLGLDDRGRLLALATQYYWAPGLDDPTYRIPHAVIWDRGNFIDLGPASDARWSRNGVDGTYPVDSAGHAVNGIVANGVIRRHFEWQDGRRSNAPIGAEGS